MATTYGDLEKPARATRGSRLSFLRTKRAIAAITLLVCAAIVLIVLGATHVIGGRPASKTSAKGVNNAANSSRSSSRSHKATSSISVAPGAVSPTTAPAAAVSSTSPTPKATTTFKTTATTTSSSSTASASNDSSTGVNKGSIAGGTPLRVMAVGASIVKGETSSGTVGFRKGFRDEVAGLGVPVNMVGTVRLGDFVDNDVEAYGGFKILQIHDKVKKAAPKYLPNIFLINEGTNNILQDIDVDKAGPQMKDLVDDMLKMSPRAVVILSTLLTNTVGGGQLEPKVLNMNKQFRDLMPQFEAEGKAVVLCEMHPSTGLTGIPQVSDIGPDGSHPTEKGYAMMAHLFTECVKVADNKNLIKVPQDNGIANDGAAERSGRMRRL